MSDFLRGEHQVLLGYPSLAWECNLCGAKFESEMSKDSHMTRCTASETDSALRTPDHLVCVANRFPFNPRPAAQYQPSPGSAAFHGAPDDFSAPVGPKWDTAQPQPAPPPALIQTQFTPESLMRRQIQYPPNPAPPYNPLSSPPIATYLTKEPRNPLFQPNNIQNLGYRPEYKPTLPPQQVPRPPYAPIATQQEILLRAPHTTTLAINQLPAQRPSEPAVNVYRTNPVPKAPVVQPDDRSTVSKLLRARVSADASVLPKPRRADGKFEVKLVWEKQRPTLETKLLYFDDKDGQMTFRWDRRKEEFHAQTRLSPGQHSGTLNLPDTDEFFSMKPFDVSPHSVGLQEIRVYLPDSTVKPRPNKALSSNPGIDRNLSQESKKSEHSVLHSEHRPLFHPGHTHGQKKDIMRDFTMNPPQEPLEREAMHSPYHHLPLEEVSLPFQNNPPREHRVEKGRDHHTPGIKLAQLQKEEQKKDVSPPHYPFPKQPTVNGNKELGRKGKLESELDDLNARYRKLEDIHRMADNENGILKREVEQFKTQYIDAISKQSRQKEVDELKQLLLKAKGEMDAMRREIEIKMQQAEQVERRKETQHSEEVKQVLAEKETYKKAAYKYREEREAAKASLEEVARAYGEFKQKYSDAQTNYSQVKQQLKQKDEECHLLKDQIERLESELSYLKKMREQYENETSPSSDLNNAFQPVAEPSSLGSNDNRDQKRKTRNISYPRTPESAAASTLLDPYSSLPVSLASIKDQPPRTTDTTTQPYKKKDSVSVMSKVHLFEQDNHSTPKVPPRRLYKAPSKTWEGVERYKPDVLTVFMNKTSSISYKENPVKVINFSYLMKPEAHTHKQVFVKVRDNWKLGSLEVVSKRRHAYLKKVEIVAGVKLQEPVGTSNGMFESVRYFNCDPNHGIFVSATEVYVPIV